MVWRRATLAGIALFCAVAAAAQEVRPTPEHPPGPKRYSAIGMASWYGSGFHGRTTANGETFDIRSLSGANRTMPLPSYARVTNLGNGRSIVVRVNDRGPFVGGRILDVSARVANLLEFERVGVTKVRLDYVGAAPPAGSDEPALLASLRARGAPVAAETAPPTVRPARDEGESVVSRVVERPRPVEPQSPYGELIEYPSSARTARAAPDLREAILARAFERPRPAEPHSPYGELYVSPFLAQAARP